MGLPIGNSVGLINYNLGKETGHNGFQLLHNRHELAKTETVVQSTISSIKLKGPNNADAFLPFYMTIRYKNHTNGTFIDPGQGYDQLYQCDNDRIKHLVKQEWWPDTYHTHIWYSPIRSGKKLIKNAQKWNKLRDKYNIIGLEMEAAGTMNQIPVSIIQGVCDYRDKHKNKEW
jgi:hypothetical protein